MLPPQRPSVVSCPCLISGGYCLFPEGDLTFFLSSVVFVRICFFPFPFLNCRFLKSVRLAEELQGKQASEKNHHVPSLIQREREWIWIEKRERESKTADWKQNNNKHLNFFLNRMKQTMWDLKKRSILKKKKIKKILGFVTFLILNIRSAVAAEHDLLSVSFAS